MYPETNTLPKQPYPVRSAAGLIDYLYWQKQNKNLLKRVNLLIKDIERNPFEGIGKPEPLKNNLSGWWSRRIDDTHRIVYRIEKGALEIAQCREHYEKS